ncbi:hypothetical protein [Streptomyces poriticola]|uniref:hypothetical protein n=1 Tax=Streptomyces poriticola TaxID=3120506 RepID=UPI002FCE5F4E
MSTRTDLAGFKAAITPHIALAATDETALRAAPRTTGDSLLAAPPSTARTINEAMSTVLEAVFATLPGELRGTAPLYMLCDDYSVFAARRLVTRCHDTERRLRPSDSIRPETSELVRPYLTEAGHHGSCYLLAGVSAGAVLELVSSSGHPAVVVCEPALLPGDDPHHRDCLAVAAAWAPDGELPALPAMSPSTPSALLNALSTGRQS